jgi:hypothetical protein
MFFWEGLLILIPFPVSKADNPLREMNRSRRFSDLPIFTAFFANLRGAARAALCVARAQQRLRLNCTEVAIDAAGDARSSDVRLSGKAVSISGYGARPARRVQAGPVRLSYSIYRPGPLVAAGCDDANERPSVQIFSQLS